MPHRRPVRKGSFGGRLADLVERFPDSVTPRDKKQTESGQTKPDDRHINERLFDAWRKARDGRAVGAKESEQP